MGASRYVLGVDGGQSYTTAAICDLTGRLLGLGRAGPSNHVWEPGGLARVRRAVTQSIARAQRAAGLPPMRFEAAFLGMTGATRQTLRAVRQCVRARRFRLENDKVSALACVTAGRPGVVAIAGTGTIIHGQNRRGETADASGWGYLIGDEGSAFWIAKQALAAASRAYDGRGPGTSLVQALTAAAGVEHLWDLHRLIYSGRISRAEMAGLAVAVNAAASAGDAAALRILREAGRELGLAVGVVARRLRMHRGATTVGMVGGVFQGSASVRNSFRREVRRHVPKAVFALPRFAPVFGCVLLALRMVGSRITPAVMRNLEAASAAAGRK
jgi:N-acetylglucosamine kinase-like BadF-type ATPase